MQENRDLDFQVNPKTETWTFQHFTWGELKTLAQKEYAFNSHFYGFSKEAFENDFGVIDELKYTAISQNPWGFDFITNIEGTKLPI